MGQFNDTASITSLNFTDLRGNIVFLPPGISTSSFNATGSSLNDLADSSGSIIIGYSPISSSFQFRIPSESAKVSQDIIPLFISSSGINPRVGIGTTSPLTAFDFKDVEETTTGTELLLRSSRTGSGAQIGDSAGKINFAIDSASFINIKTTGSIAVIETKVDAVDGTGVTGEFIIGVSNTKSEGPIDRFRINNAQTEITGALNTSANITAAGKISSSNIETSGFLSAESLTVGSTIDPGANNLKVQGNANVDGNTTLGITNGNIIAVSGSFRAKHTMFVPGIGDSSATNNVAVIDSGFLRSSSVDAKIFANPNTLVSRNILGAANSHIPFYSSDTTILTSSTSFTFNSNTLSAPGFSSNANILIIGANVSTTNIFTTNLTASIISSSGTITGNSLVGTVGTATQGTIDHDSLANFVANEHIDHSGVSITAGAGLTGGGTIASTRDIAVGAGTGVTVNADDVAIGQDVAITANVQFANITGSAISASGDILGNHYKIDGNSLANTSGTTTLSIGAASFYDRINLGKPNSTTVQVFLPGQVTASGDISASGTIFTDTLSSPSNDLQIPSDTVTITAGTAGDANLILHADTDNNDETDNPYMYYKQDGDGGVLGIIGLSAGANVWPDGTTLTGATANSMVIGMTGSAASTNRQVIIAAGNSASIVVKNDADVQILESLIVDNDITATQGTSNFNVIVSKTNKLSVTSAVHGNHQGDVVFFGGENGTIAAGDIVYYNSSGNWGVTDADAEATADGLLGVALGSDASVNGVLLKGVVTLDHDPGTVGDPLYLSTTPGQASSTAPSGTDDIVRLIGYCLDSTNGQIYFNPSNDFIKHA